MELTLAQLARRGGVSTRTIRYYIQRGLLPPPAFRGPDTCYQESHLLGLQAIRALQAAYWPLDAIATILQGRSLAQLRALAGGALPEAPKTNAASRASSPPVAAGAAEPALAASAAPARVHGTRLTLAPGLELWLDDAASEPVRQLAAALERWVASQKTELSHD